ncbi:MAG: hypothetical protein ACOYYS_00485 [Chloroflexota bacterium]
MNNLKFHGVTSVIFAGVAIALAVMAMFQSALWAGIGYLFVCVIGSSVVLYSFCAKCPCKARCGHVFPGKAAMLFKRRPGPYSKIEVYAMLVALLLLVGWPQPALLGRPGTLITFWVLIGVAGIQARSMVCRACGNVYCPLNKAKQTVSIAKE